MLLTFTNHEGKTILVNTDFIVSVTPFDYWDANPSPIQRLGVACIQLVKGHEVILRPCNEVIKEIQDQLTASPLSPLKPAPLKPATHELMQREFPRFDQTTLPAIPAGWTDISWHNDLCPSFEAGENLRVYIDYPEDSDERESSGDRFTVHDDADDSDDRMFTSDDWAAILSFVATKLSRA